MASETIAEIALSTETNATGPFFSLLLNSDEVPDVRNYPLDGDNPSSIPAASPSGSSVLAMACTARQKVRGKCLQADLAFVILS